MNPGIFLIQDNEELVEMNEQAYDSEKRLQTWLAKYPELLVGNQIDAAKPRRFLLIEQECGVPSEEGGSGRWSMDHLFLDQDAIPTIVEVKRSSDTRVRREVVGQMLDYAANAVAHWPVSHMRERFAANCKTHNLDPGEKIADFLDGEQDPEQFWEKAARNLQERKLRLLFVADVIPTELQRIVEFLNDQMDQTEVLAIEIKQFVSPKGLKSLAPRVVGQTVKALQKKEAITRGAPHDEETFFAEINEKAASAEAGVARGLLEWAKPPLFTGMNWRRASFSPTLTYKADYYIHNPITVYTDGKVEVQFKRMAKRTAPFDRDEKRFELLRRLNQISGLNLPADSINKFPRFSMSLLSDPKSLKEFETIIEWTIKEVIANNNPE